MPCIDAMTPSVPKRGMSCALRCCACSTRQRTFFLSGIGVEGALEDVERLAVGAVADRVHAQLVAVLHREPRGLLDVRDRSSVFRPELIGLVGVGLEQPRAARSERAVDLLLDRAHREVAVAVADHPVLRELRPDDVVGLPDHHPQPDAELVLRRPSSSSRRSCASGEPASSNVVMPFDSASSIGELEQPCACALPPRPAVRLSAP